MIETEGKLIMTTEPDWRLFRTKNGITILSACVHGKPCHTQQEAQEAYKDDMLFFKHHGWKVEIVEIHELFHAGDSIDFQSYRQ